MSVELLGPTARRAVAKGAAEASGLAHDHVGTEHLLLGLITTPGGAASALADAGVTASAARYKATEAVGTAASDTPAVAADGDLPHTARASRAFERAVRFSHQRRAAVVTSTDLLHAVLDVEGRAGQVLRGLGIDIDGLVRRLGNYAEVDAAESGAAESSTASAEETVPAKRVAAPAQCSSCQAPLDGNLVYRTLAARGKQGPRDAVVFSCGLCGAAIGVVGPPR